MREFVHLHNHSEFSLLDGAAPVNDLVKKAEEYEMKHLALTDHGNMFGALHFYKACKAAGVNPLVGSEFYVAPGSRIEKKGSERGNKYYHLVLLAKNATGYKNLLKLSSAGYTEGFYYKPRIDNDLLEQHSDGLMALSACIAGEIPSNILHNQKDHVMKRIDHYKNLFGKDSFYLELQDHGIEEQKTINRALIELSKTTKVPLVATNDVHYMNKSDANAQDILLCIGTNSKKQQQDRMRFDGDQFYFKSAREMNDLFSHVPEAIENTVRAAEQCALDIELPGPLLPDYTIPDRFKTPDDYLRHLTYEGVKARYGGLTDELKKRADYELGIIINMGFTGYFLIVWDFIRYAKDHTIPVGPGRGSGAGSIVAYALEITNIEPLKYGLLFERFLNPERVSMPDFDIDFCFERRQEVIQYVTGKYGEEKVGQIITFGTLKAKAVLKDVARALDIPYSEAETIAKNVPEGPKVKLKDAIETEPKLKELSQDSRYRELFQTGLRLEGLSRHSSTHAAGIVIGKKELTEYVPLYRDSKTGAISTQFTMDQLEECGLVKMDFLGLKTLTLITNTVDLIKKHGINIDIEAIPEDDETTFSMLGEGLSTCIFQFESPGMQAILKRTKPGSIEELIALNALYRPGPMQFIDQFIDSKWGRKPIKYPHPDLEQVLKETYGVIVYQEQVMEIARVIAGFSLGQADILRRAMGKKKVKEMEKQKKLFIEGALKIGRTKKQAEDIFELLKPFAGYGFNKSHAAAYSVLAYQTAYLKANHPAEFMAANLTNEINNPKKLTSYIGATREMGIDILAPNINLSEKYFSVTDGKIVYGLIGIKNVGSGVVDHIVAERHENGPFASFIDFLKRIDLKMINHRVFETLIQAGLFDKLGLNRASLTKNLDTAIEHVSKEKEMTMYGQNSLFDENEKTAFPDFVFDEVEEWPQRVLLNHEKEFLGFFFSAHPLDSFRDQWEKCANMQLDTETLMRANQEKEYTMLGMLKEIKTITTKKNDRMAFAVLEDFAGSVELVIFPRTFAEFQQALIEDDVVGIVGKVDMKKEEPKIIVNKIMSINDMKDINAREIHVKLAERSWEEDDLFQLREVLAEEKGPGQIYLHVKTHEGNSEVVLKVSPQLSTSLEKQHIERIKVYPDVVDVWKE